MFGGVSLGGGGGAAQLRELRVYVALGDSEKAKNYVPNMFQFGKGELEKLRENDPKLGRARATAAASRCPRCRGTSQPVATLIERLSRDSLVVIAQS